MADSGRSWRAMFEVLLDVVGFGVRWCEKDEIWVAVSQKGHKSQAFHMQVSVPSIPGGVFFILEY